MSDWGSEASLGLGVMLAEEGTDSEPLWCLLLAVMNDGISLLLRSVFRVRSEQRVV